MRIFISLLLIPLFGCVQQSSNTGFIQKKPTTRIAMQRIIDTEPLAKQTFVNRDAMQLALVDKLNMREEDLTKRFFETDLRHKQEFLKTAQQQKQDFLKTNQQQQDKFTRVHLENIQHLDNIAVNMESSERELGKSVGKIIKFNDSFRMIASDMEESNLRQNEYFNDMRITYENKLNFEKAKQDIEKDRENTIRRVVDNMYDDKKTATQKFYQSTKEGMLPPSEWVDLEDAEITIHVENEQLEPLMLRSINKAAIHSGPWLLKWKLKKENRHLLSTKFSLDAEMNFGEFIANVKEYIYNYNGITLNFRLFKEKRILIVSDS
ncbi:MAG: hypothetical protein GY793_08645 [Proteobacteria bacterium]|nr:hypothetical protein [Pseudomonadota bacterium]